MKIKDIIKYLNQYCNYTIVSARTDEINDYNLTIQDLSKYEDRILLSIGLRTLDEKMENRLNAEDVEIALVIDDKS